MDPQAPVTGVLLDLDGTVYRGTEAVPGAARFLERLGAAGIPFLFVTNRANRSPEEVQRQLAGMGIVSRPEQVLTSAQAAARHLAGGSAYCIGEAALTAALEEAGIAIEEGRSGAVPDAVPDAVVVGLDRGITYGKLETATRLILQGARFVATNRDRLVNSDGGLSPGNGALVAAVATATGREPVVVGKPQRTIMEAAVERIGLAPAGVIMVGDNPETDIAAARNTDLRSALILTGITDRATAEALAPPPTWIVEGYDALERLVLG